MATQAIDTPTFSRITSKGRPTSWAVGLPVAIIIVALIGLFAYFASKSMSAQEQLAAANKTVAQQQTSLDAAQKRLGQLDSDIAIANSPGKTTLMLQPAKGETAWGSAVWGEAAGNKGFVQLRAYGLKEAAQGKAYHAWLDVDGARPQLLGVLDVNATGSAFVMGKDLPVAKAKRVFVALDDEKATAPQGTPTMEASLQAPAKKADAE